MSSRRPPKTSTRAFISLKLDTEEFARIAALARKLGLRRGTPHERSELLRLALFIGLERIHQDPAIFANSREAIDHKEKEP